MGIYLQLEVLQLQQLFQFVGDGSELTGVASTANIITNAIRFTDSNIKIGNTASSSDSVTTGSNNVNSSDNGLTAPATGEKKCNCW